MILIVEGESDRIVLQGWARKLGYPLEEIHAAVVPARGVTKAKYHLKLWAEVARDIGLTSYVFVDKDGGDEVDKIVSEGLIQKENTHVLENGCIEDYYPIDILVDALKTIFSIPVVKEDILTGGRVKTISKLLKKEPWEWKVPLAEEVSKTTERRQVPRAVANFIRQVYSDNKR